MRKWLGNEYVRIVLVLLAIVLYLFLGYYVVEVATKTFTNEYFSMLGNKALDIAEISAAKYEITDQEVRELKALNFSEILEHPANQRLSELFETGHFSSDLKYAYIMVELNDDEIQYTVTEDTSVYYKAPAGTKLDLFWLTDVIINQSQKAEAEAEEDYYNNRNRYSIMRENDREVYSKRESSYILTEDEYGLAFSGLVPIHSVEGSFVGLLGVDLYFESFSEWVEQMRILLTLVYLIPTLLLTIIYAVVYIKRIKNSDKEANTDALTGLYNRRYLNLVLPQLVKNAFYKMSNLSVIMIDIDFFKNYNDNYGHQMGDEVIVLVSNAISGVLRKKLDIVCRYGGEEIMVLLAETDEAGAVHVAEKIQTAIESVAIKHEFSSVAGHITVSQGIYTHIPGNSDRISAYQYITKADEALYKAKRCGRNRYCVSE